MIDEGEMFDMKNMTERLLAGEATVGEGLYCLLTSTLSVEQIGFVTDCKKKGMSSEDSMAALREQNFTPKFSPEVPEEFFRVLGDLSGAIAIREAKAKKEKEGENDGSEPA